MPGDSPHSDQTRRLEQMLRDNDERYLLVSEAVAEGIYDWNVERNSLFVSSRLMEMFGFKGSGLAAEDWYGRVHPDDINSYRTAVRDCFTRRSTKLHCQYRIKVTDGEYRWVDDHGLPVRNEAGRAIRLVGAVSDVTAEKEQARQADILFQQFNAVLDTIDYGVLFMGPDLRSKIINRAFRNMWGIPDQFIQKTRPTMADLINYNRYKGLYNVPETEFDDYVARRVEVVRSGAAFEVEMRRRDGRIIHHQIQVLPDGGRLLTYFDITGLKRSEEAARQARDAAETALAELKIAQDRLVQTQKLASLGQLTAGIAHEIKNPLNFVNNFSTLSRELIDELGDALNPVAVDDKKREELDALTQLLKGNLEKVVQHGKRADQIVKNMLLHSREGSGERRLADLNAVVEDSLNLAYHGARAKNQKFELKLERSFDPAAGEVELFPQAITHALLNLISNSFYAAMKRKAEMKLGGYEPTLAAATRNLGDHVEIKIRDNGEGIPPEIKDKIFNPFFTTKPPGEGTGLGLSLSHDIVVKQHSGSIEVDSQPGEFTEFRIILPRTGATRKAPAST
jgi:PAS domain S-box-containing protein